MLAKNCRKPPSTGTDSKPLTTTSNNNKRLKRKKQELVKSEIYHGPKRRCSTCKSHRTETFFLPGKVTCVVCLQRRRKPVGADLDGKRRCSTCRATQDLDNFDGTRVTCNKCLSRKRLKDQRKHGGVANDNAGKDTFAKENARRMADSDSVKFTELSASCAPVQPPKNPATAEGSLFDDWFTINENCLLDLDMLSSELSTFDGCSTAETGAMPVSEPPSVSAVICQGVARLSVTQNHVEVKMEEEEEEQEQWGGFRLKTSDSSYASMDSRHGLSASLSCTTTSAHSDSLMLPISDDCTGNEARGLFQDTPVRLMSNPEYHQ